MSQPNFIPNLAGRVDPVVDKTIQDLYQQINNLQGRLDAVTKTIPPPLDLAQVSKELSALGHYPLNIQGLIGVTASPQKAASGSFNPPSDGGASLGSLTPTLLRFLNLFIKSGINVGGSTAIATPNPLEVRVAGTGTGTAQAHLAPGDVDDGTWIMSLSIGGHPGIWLSQGARFDGTNWVAKNAQATVLAIDQGGNFSLNFNSGLTIGNTFTLTQVLVIDKTGILTTYEGSGTLANGTMTIPAATSNGSIVFRNGIVKSFTSPVGN